ncbi:MAG: hypothetical protein AAB588_03890 [Patescibacteria group bacterium]
MPETETILEDEGLPLGLERIDPAELSQMPIQELMDQAIDTLGQDVESDASARHRSRFRRMVLIAIVALAGAASGVVLTRCAQLRMQGTDDPPAPSDPSHDEDLPNETRMG